MTSIAEMGGARKSAILLLALDEDSAAEVFKFLSASEVQEISTEMARLHQVSHEDMKAVLEAFRDTALSASRTQLTNEGGSSIWKDIERRHQAQRKKLRGAIHEIEALGIAE